MDMEDCMTKSKSITVGDLLKMFLQHIKLIIILSLLGTVIAFLYVSYMVTPIYSTSALILVQNGSTFESDYSTSTSLNGEKVNTNDITSSVMLANTCSTLFTVDPDMKSLISGASVSISAVEDSYFLRINSTSADPHTAANIANLVANTAPSIFKKYFGDAGKVAKVDDALVSEQGTLHHDGLPRRIHHFSGNLIPARDYRYDHQARRRPVQAVRDPGLCRDRRL